MNEVSRETISIAAERLKSEQRTRQSNGTSASALMRRRRREGLRVVPVVIKADHLVARGFLAADVAERLRRSVARDDKSDLDALAKAAQIFNDAALPMPAAKPAPPPIAKPTATAIATAPAPPPPAPAAPAMPHLNPDEIMREYVGNGGSFWQSRWGLPYGMEGSYITYAVWTRWAPAIARARARSAG